MSQHGAESLFRSADGKSLTSRQPETGRRRTRRQTVTALQVIPSFSGFSRRHLERLAKETDEMTFAPGDVIVQEGMLGETLFIILEGRAKVLRGGRKVAEDPAGGVLRRALDPGRRSADGLGGRHHAGAGRSGCSAGRCWACSRTSPGWRWTSSSRSRDGSARWTGRSGSRLYRRMRDAALRWVG